MAGRIRACQSLISRSKRYRRSRLSFTACLSVAAPQPPALSIHWGVPPRPAKLTSTELANAALVIPCGDFRQLSAQENLNRGPCKAPLFQEREERNWQRSPGK